MSLSTLLVLLIPAAFVAMPFLGLGPSAMFLAWIGGFTVVIYVSVWVYFRPSRFDMDDHYLHIIWPMRKRSILRGSIQGAELLSGKEFRQKYGLGVRIGAGGLWGGFGRFKTGTHDFHLYVSRISDWVVITCQGDMPWILTPEKPEDFVRALKLQAPTSSRKP